VADNLFQNRDRILARMRAMPKKLADKGARTAVRKGANVIAKAARANWQQLDDPATARSIAKNVAVQASSRLGKREGGVAYRVGIRGGAFSRYKDTKKNRRSGVVGQQRADVGGSTWYWRFLELGTSKLAARSPMRKAMASNADRALAVIATELDNEITKLSGQP